MTPIPKKENGYNDWIEYRQLVLDKLDRLKKIEDTQVKILLDIRELKVKSAVWGGAAALVVSSVIGAITTKLVGLW